MKENICAFCKKPIVGYYYILNPSVHICFDCGHNTVASLYQRAIIDIGPDVFDIEAISVSNVHSDSDAGIILDSNDVSVLDAIADEFVPDSSDINSVISATLLEKQEEK